MLNSIITLQFADAVFGMTNTTSVNDVMEQFLGVGRISTALSKVVKTDEGLLAETLAEQFPDGVCGLNTTTALAFETTEQLSVATEHTAAVGCLQFCSCGRKPEPVIDIVALAYVRPGLVGAKYRILGRADQDINAVA